MKHGLKYFCLIALLIAAHHYASAQKPHVRYITKTSSTVLEEIELHGSGFHEDKNKLAVYFGAVRGEILSASESKLTVKVPAGATYDNIYVTNLESNLSGSANEFFLLSYGGDEFAATNLKNQEIYPGAPSSAGLLDFCLCDLDNDGNYRFKSPTMEVRSLDEAFRLFGQDYVASATEETKLTFAESDEEGAELSILRFGAPAPNWHAQDFEGNPVKLSDFRGKFVFFDVWATWCGPCIGEIPHIQEAQEKYGDQVIGDRRSDLGTTRRGHSRFIRDILHFRVCRFAQEATQPDNDKGHADN